MKKLIYFTLSHNYNYIKLAELCIKSLYENKYDGDFLFITNLKNEILDQIEFKSEPKFLLLNNKNDLLESSANKLKLFLLDNVYEYDKIIFSDLDVLWTSNPDLIFNLIHKDEFYMSNENSLMSDEWWGGRIFNESEKANIIESQTKGLNAGIFAFNKKMVQHLQQIDLFLSDNLNLLNICLEQPFLNAYLYRKKIYNTKLNGLISHNGYHTNSFNGVALHFAGGPGNFDTKYDKMIKYYTKNKIKS